MKKNFLLKVCASSLSSEKEEQRDEMCVFTLFQVIENGPSTMLSLQWEVSHFAISAMGAFSHL